MKKIILLAAVALLSATSVFAQTESTKNAVCVTFKSGDAKFVAFTEEPKIIARQGQIFAITSGGTTTKVCDVIDLDKITAVHHDFTSTGISLPELELGETPKVYTLDGRQVTTLESGKVYIIKTSRSTKKFIKK